MIRKVAQHLGKQSNFVDRRRKRFRQKRAFVGGKRHYSLLFFMFLCVVLLLPHALVIGYETIEDETEDAIILSGVSLLIGTQVMLMSLILLYSAALELKGLPPERGPPHSNHSNKDMIAAPSPPSYASLAVYITNVFQPLLNNSLTLANRFGKTPFIQNPPTHSTQLHLALQSASTDTAHVSSNGFAQLYRVEQPHSKQHGVRNNREHKNVC